MLDHSKKLALRLVTLLTIAAGGLTGGWAVAGALQPAALAAAEVPPCENDECEGGVLCEDNPGGNTGCNRTSGDSCSTYGC